MSSVRLGTPPLPIHSWALQMFKRNCVVKFVDSFGIEHAAKVEAESLFEAAVRGLHRGLEFLDGRGCVRPDVCHGRGS